MIMAAAHSTLKARSGQNSRLKSSGTRLKSAKRSKILAKRRKTKPAQSPGPATPDRQGLPITERGARILVRGRLQEMIRMELSNLGKAESVLRCLSLSMDSMELDKGSAYFPDVVEVAGDLVQRSIVDLDELYDGRIPDRLMAALKVE
jgi:hypothetical protein